MKIIQHGRPETVLNPIKRFKCVFCGCVFEAEKDEYQSDIQYNTMKYISGVSARSVGKVPMKCE